MPKSAYTARSPTDVPGGLPSGWDSTYLYPDVAFDPYPTTPSANPGIPGHNFPNGFPVVAPGAQNLAVNAAASMSLASHKCAVEITMTQAGDPASAFVNHLIEIRAKKAGGAYTTLKLVGGAGYQQALWVKVKKYATTPKYGCYEQLDFDLTGFVDTDDLVVEANVRTANCSGTDTVDLTSGTS